MSANTVDVGFYGRYNDGSNRYLGLFADASDSNAFKLFKGYRNRADYIQ